MFGSLRIKRCQLDDELSELYRAHFCAGCHALAQFGGKRASLLTNYDQTLLVVVAAGVESTGGPDVPVTAEAEVHDLPCTAVPFRRVPVRSLSRRARELVATLNVALVAAKVQDDITDERRWTYRLAGKLLRAPAARAEEQLFGDGFRAAAFHEIGSEQARAEAQMGRNLRDYAEPTAQLLGQIFQHLATLHVRPSDVAVGLERLGRALGIYLYVWDAIIDRSRDARRGRFNAIAACADPATAAATLAEQLDEIAQAADDVLPSAEGQIVAALVATLRGRAQGHSLERRAGDEAAYQRQAGACDCCCEVGSCAPEACCSCGDLCAGCVECCCWTESAKARRQKRKARRAQS
ncbi:MAG: DUF5685 family protein [Planctomycetota bacterium]